MKKTLFLVIALVFSVFLFQASVFAEEKPITVTIDNQMLAMDVSPVVIDGRTLVPLRAIFEALGAQVSWDAATQNITGTKGSTKVLLRVGQKNAIVNGNTIALDVAPQIVNGRTMVPVRFVSEALGSKVEWDGAAKVIRISTNGGGLQCAVLLTTDYGVYDKWFSTGNKYEVTLTDTDKLCIDQNGVLTATFTGFKVNDAGKGNVKYDIKITNPSGRVHYESKDITGIDPAANGVIDAGKKQLAWQYTPFAVYSYNPVGKYKIEITAHDLIANTTATATKEIEVAKYVDQKTEITGNISMFVAFYSELDNGFEYLNSAMMAYCKEGKIYDSKDMFFVEAYAKNKFLLPSLKERISTADADTKKFAEAMVKHIESYFEKGELKDAPLCGPSGLFKIEDIRDLYSSYGQFQASSSYFVLYTIAECLQWESYEKEFTKSDYDTKYESLSANKQKALMYLTAKDMLISAIEKGGYSKAYLQQMLTDEEFDPAFKARLKKLLEEN